MMTQQLELSIIAAPLGAIDRRALSQAWYSALRIAAQREPAALRLGCGQALWNAPCAAPHVLPRGATKTQCHTSVASSARRASGAGPKRLPNSAQDPAVSLVTRSPLAAQIERAFCRPRAYPKRATLSVGRGRARVHVILQTSGTKAALLAVCRPEMREIVARALAQARVALASRGIDAVLTA